MFRGEEVWSKVQRSLQKNLSKPSYETWIGPAKFYSYENDILTLIAPNPFSSNYLKKNYSDTIEGLADDDGTLHPVQQAFHECHALQCGYCTPGMVMASVSMIEENPSMTEDEVREGLEGNLCRCTGYHNIVKAVLQATEVTL